MTRDEAVGRIQDGLGFSATMATQIAARLREAQGHLERGKTLPKFLIEQDSQFILVEGTRETAKPDGFLQEVDEGILWTSDLDPPELIKVPDINTGYAILGSTDLDSPAAPKIYTMLGQSIWFFTPADQTYIFSWDFYKAAEPLTSDISNVWLDDAVGAYLLIGEAGLRMAKDRRNPSAVTLFTDMRNEAWKALFTEIVAEESSVPIFMGSAL